MGTSSKDTLYFNVAFSFAAYSSIYNTSDNLCEHSSITKLLYKEVIQPQVPLRLPCYDFTPVMNHTVVNAPPRRLSYLLLVQPTPMV